MSLLPSFDLSNADDRSAAAGEYVLGTLEPGEHSSFETILKSDQQLQAAVHSWQDYLLSLSQQAMPVQPSTNLWPRVEASLIAGSKTAQAAQAAQAVQPASAATARPSTQQAISEPRRPPIKAASQWWQQSAFWRGLSALAVAASILMATALLRQDSRPPAGGTRYLALLQSPDQRLTGWIVEVQSGGTVRLVPMAPGAPIPADRVLQFWTKPKDAASPTSLGVVRAGQTFELPVSQLPAVGEQQLFEITLEPEGGSPIGRPTGPILFVGRSQKI